MGERLGRESFFKCVTRRADAGISMAKRRNKNEVEAGYKKKNLAMERKLDNQIRQECCEIAERSLESG